LHLLKVEHSALREVLERVRDGRVHVARLTTQHELKYGGCLGPRGAASLGACLAACAHLTTLALRGQRVGPHGGRALARGLKQAPALTYLDVSANALTASGAVPVCAAVVASRGGRRLQVLLLDANRIDGPDCCAVLATGLKELRGRGRPAALTRVSFTNNPGLEGLSRLHAEAAAAAHDEALKGDAEGRQLPLFVFPQVPSLARGSLV